MRFHTIKFRITCRHCGHANMPDNNTRRGILKTLTGEFCKCRGCGTEWESIRVPLRPLVQKMAEQIKSEGRTFTSRVVAYRYKKEIGRVPRSIAV